MKKVIWVIVLLLTLCTFGCQKEVPPINEPPKEEPEINDNELTFDEKKEEIITWLNSQFNNLIVDKNIVFPQKYEKYNAQIEVFSFYEEYLSSEGTYNAPVLDTKTELLFIITLDEQEIDISIPIVIKGWGDEFDAVQKEIEEMFNKPLSSNVNFPLVSLVADCSIRWESTNENIITSNGRVNKDPNYDREVLVKYYVTYNGETKEFQLTLTVLKMSNNEKISLTADWIETEIFKSKEITSNLDLVSKYDLYNALIIWESWNPTAISDKGIYHKPFKDEEVMLDANIIVGGTSGRYRFNLIAKGENEENMWEKIESFLDKINVKEIKNQKFTLYGSELGYEYVPSQNIGYLPFYDEKEMEIIVDLLPDDSPLKPNTLRKETKYIVIHNTGMAHPSATAKGLNEYIHTTTRVASWHFSIDDKETYQQLGIDEVGWHAGDGSRTYLETWSGGIGGGNQNGIGIESCVYEGVDFNKVMRRLAKLTAMLLIKYDLDIQAVKQHNDFSGKDCPQVIRHANRWEELLDLIRLEYFAQTELKDVHFEWISLNPEIMDNEGTVINHPGNETTINYKVKVTYQGETKEFTYQSKLLKLND